MCYLTVLEELNVLPEGVFMLFWCMYHSSREYLAVNIFLMLGGICSKAVCSTVLDLINLH